MLRPVRLAIPIVFSCLSACTCVAPQHPELTGRVEEADLESGVVGDTYRVFVRLPPDYDSQPGRRFPVVLQLDANLPILEEFAVTAGFASSLEASGAIPSTIVVGLGYGGDADHPYTGRGRDYTIPMQHPDVLGGNTGEALAFYEFLRTELWPYVERTYRVAGPEGRALFGHSLGGLFATWAFLRQDPTAPMFSGFVAASPALHFDQGGIYRDLDALATRAPAMPVALFMTVGSLEGPFMDVYFDDFIRRLEALGVAGLWLEGQKYDTDHVGTVAPSFRDGLRSLFAHGLKGDAP
jgi:hypothetical protein